MRKTHKKMSRNKRKTHKKTSRNKRKTSTHRRHNRQGGVGTLGQAAALQQVFNTVNRPYARNEIAEILAHQSYRDMEKSTPRGRGGPSQATLSDLRARGTQVARDNQRSYDDQQYVRDANRAAFDRAMLQRHGPPPPGGYGIMPLAPARQRREISTPFDRFER